MKKIILILFLFFVGCSQHLGRLSIASTRDADVLHNYISIGPIQGEANIMVMDSYKMPSIEDAIQNALFISGADLITDASFQLETTHILLYINRRLIVTGEGWVKTHRSSKTTPTKEKIFIKYDPKTGKPIYE